MRFTFELNDELNNELELIAEKGYDGNKTLAINTILKSAFENNIVLPVGKQKYSINEIRLFKQIDFDLINGSVSADFKRNFNNLPKDYQYALFELLYTITNGSSVAGDINKNQCFVSTTQNLALYYADDTNKHSLHVEGYLNFYLNIKGVYGKDSVANYLKKINRKFFSFDNSSPIWVSRMERFVSGRFCKSDNKFFDEMLSALNINNPSQYNAVQLSVDKINELVSYYKEVMPVK